MRPPQQTVIKVTNLHVRQDMINVKAKCCGSTEGCGSSELICSLARKCLDGNSNSSFSRSWSLQGHELGGRRGP